MASVNPDSNGRYRVQYMDNKGDRKTIRLGTRERKNAQTTARHIEALLEASNFSQPLRRETAVWLDGIGDDLRGKLVAAGLIQGAKPALLLGAFLDEYISQRESEVEPGTMLVIKQAKRWLLDFFKPTKPLAEITAADADEYKAYLTKGRVRNSKAKKPRARATVHKWCRYAREFFQAAVRKEFIAKNPFEHIKGGVVGDPSRRMFIPAEDVLRVIDQVPDTEFKLIIALGRFCGLRIPTEAQALTWADVNWLESMMTIRSSKTARHASGVRLVPIFPEVLVHLQAQRDQAKEGAVSVLTKYRDKTVNLRTSLERYTVAAGLVKWPKPWQNMRVSCARELSDAFPSHVCNAWMGHTERIANAYYRAVSQDHIAKAITFRAGAKTDATPVQNQAQQLPADSCKEEQKLTEILVVCDVMQPDAIASETLQRENMGVTGIEDLSKLSGNTQFFNQGGAKSDVLRLTDALLVQIVQRWPSLAGDVKHTIRELIEPPHAGK